MLNKIKNTFYALKISGILNLIYWTLGIILFFCYIYFLCYLDVKHNTKTYVFSYFFAPTLFCFFCIFIYAMFLEDFFYYLKRKYSDFKYEYKKANNLKEKKHKHSFNGEVIYGGDIGFEEAEDDDTGSYGTFSNNKSEITIYEPTLELKLSVKKNKTYKKIKKIVKEKPKEVNRLDSVE